MQLPLARGLYNEWEISKILSGTMVRSCWALRSASSASGISTLWIKSDGRGGRKGIILQKFTLYSTESLKLWEKKAFEQEKISSLSKIRIPLCPGGMNVEFLYIPSSSSVNYHDVMNPHFLFTRSISGYLRVHGEHKC